MVVDGEGFIPLDVLGMHVTLILMEVDTDALPTCQTFGFSLELQQLLIGDTFTES